MYFVHFSEIPGTNLTTYKHSRNDEGEGYIFLGIAILGLTYLLLGVWEGDLTALMRIV